MYYRFYLYLMLTLFLIYCKKMNSALSQEKAVVLLNEKDPSKRVVKTTNQGTDITKVDMDLFVIQGKKITNATNEDLFCVYNLVAQEGATSVKYVRLNEYPIKRANISLKVDQYTELNNENIKIALIDEIPFHNESEKDSIIYLRENLGQYVAYKYNKMKYSSSQENTEFKKNEKFELVDNVLLRYLTGLRNYLKGRFLEAMVEKNANAGTDDKLSLRIFYLIFSDKSLYETAYPECLASFKDDWDQYYKKNEW